MPSQTMEKFQTSLFTCLLLLLHLSISDALRASTIPFSRGFNPLFGEDNIVRSPRDYGVRLHLNQYTGSGFKSKDHYEYGIFSARIKLPSEYTAGVVVAFYTSNGEIFEKRHDELDIEFLGNIGGKPWRFQTNMYGNGSTSRGREERYFLWFDPSKEFHRYTILWTHKSIIFFIDEVPIREITRNDAMGGDYPTKPMALYATIWDASNWATSGGKYKVNYKYAPFVAEFADLALHGSAADPLQQVLARNDGQESSTNSVAHVTTKQRAAMKKFRLKYMYYSYCYDTLRYAVPLPECVIDPIERERFKETGRVKFEGNRHYRRSKRSRSHGFDAGISYGNQDEE